MNTQTLASWADSNRLLVKPYGKDDRFRSVYGVPIGEAKARRDAHKLSDYCVQGTLSGNGLLFYRRNE